MLYEVITLKDRESLTTPHDVPASKFIDRLAKYLKENVDDVQPPIWAPFTKTGTHVQHHRITSYNVCYTKLLREINPLRISFGA